MANVAKWVQEQLASDPDAVFCVGCNLYYKPEKYDGEFIVNVVRFEGDPPGTPGVAVCNDCLDIVKQTGGLHRDSLVVNTQPPDRAPASEDLEGAQSAAPRLKLVVSH